MKICAHPRLPTDVSLVKCPDCGEYFAVKTVRVIAASRGKKPGVYYQFTRSNMLGHLDSDIEQFTRPHD